METDATVPLQVTAFNANGEVVLRQMHVMPGTDIDEITQAYKYAQRIHKNKVRNSRPPSLPNRLIPVRVCVQRHDLSCIIDVAI